MQSLLPRVHFPKGRPVSFVEPFRRFSSKFLSKQHTDFITHTGRPLLPQHLSRLMVDLTHQLVPCTQVYLPRCFLWFCSSLFRQGSSLTGPKSLSETALFRQEVKCLRERIGDADARHTWTRDSEGRLE